MDHLKRSSIWIGLIVAMLILTSCGSPDPVETPVLDSASNTHVTPTDPPAPPTPTETTAPSPTALAIVKPTGTTVTHQTYDIGSEIWGLAVADLNGDSHPDIAAADRSLGMVKLLFNNGDGTFNESGEIKTGAANSVAASDLDGDTILDLAISNGTSGTVSVLFGLGDGTFQEPVDYNAGSEPSWIFTEDLNGDAHLDLVVPDFPGDLNVFLNNGDGTFQESQGYFTGGKNHGVQASAGDLNDDTYPDLAVRHYPDPIVSVLLNNGDGTFGEPIDYEVLFGPHWVTIANLDDDSHPDLAVPNQRGSMSILLNNGDGTFQDRVDYDIGGDPHYTTAIDMDGDSDLDLLVSPTGSGTVSVLSNNGEGIFELTKDYYFAGAGANYFVVTDVDGNDKRDLVSTRLRGSVYVLPIDD